MQTNMYRTWLSSITSSFNPSASWNLFSTSCKPDILPSNLRFAPSTSVDTFAR
ncbi:unnamed protein product [Chondrus crispus]|uniref:Uncharacterized protein n=1 Tax=Chondrus crispus TaxID=2769 RepID=R7QM99_CHOCR|nr:unnamed protein product [Chondrus crispus]CDF39632.1 unnamed protein product [Chondrus crispus]|eukprot:XP_005709926.1 unnamed protein product [Chondrus crispus]